MKKYLSFILALVIALSLMPFAAFAADEPEETEAVEIPDFPHLHITCELDPFDIDRELWHNGSVSMTDTEEDFMFDDLSVRIRGRGNSTWWRGPEKRPLRLRFPEPRAMLDSEHEARDWILLANLFDGSLLRNYSALYLAGLLDGMYWSPFSRFVHLHVNGEYWGLYQITDERDVGPGRAQLVFDPDPALSDYFLEIDDLAETWLRDGYVEDEDFFAVEGRAFDIRFPSESRWDGHLEFARDFVQEVNDIIRSRDYEAIKAVVDIPAFIDFYIVQEFFKNIDIGYRSVFFQIKGQGEDRRLVFGPVWDFDRSAGNTTDFWTTPERIFAGERCYWFKELLSVPEIFALTAERWNEIKDDQIAQMIGHVAETAQVYKTSFEKNFERHDHIFGSNPPQWFTMLPRVIWTMFSFEDHAAFLIDWFEARAEWLDDHFNGRPLRFTPPTVFSDIPVFPATSAIYVNGEQINFEAYFINGHNYFRLRDLAYALNGTDKQFEIGWDGETDAIAIISNQPYTPTGIEMASGNNRPRLALPNENINISKDGEPVEIAAYLINENNFVKLRDVMRLIDVYVGWDEETSTITLDTSKGYVEPDPVVTEDIEEDTEEEIYEETDEEDTEEIEEIEESEEE
jgi:hypothetical protein